MLFLWLSEAQTCKWAVFATSWNYHLQIAQRGMVFAACCGYLRLTSVNCTVFATFRNQHVQLAWDLQLFESNMCTWEGARSILELGLHFFLPAVLLPSFPLSFPSSCPSFYSCWFSILIPFSSFFHLFPLINLREGLGASVACNRHVNSSDEVSSPLPWLLHGLRECPQLLR